METISERNSKEEIITSSLELIDSQQLKLNNYKEQQKILFSVIAILAIFSLI